MKKIELISKEKGSNKTTFKCSVNNFPEDCTELIKMLEAATPAQQQHAYFTFFAGYTQKGKTNFDDGSNVEFIKSLEQLGRTTQEGMLQAVGVLVNNIGSLIVRITSDPVKYASMLPKIGDLVATQSTCNDLSASIRKEFKGKADDYKTELATLRAAFTAVKTELEKIK